MLVKSFIDKNTVQELLIWTDTQNLQQNCVNGNLSFYTFLKDLNNFPSSINEVRKKCQNLVGGVYQEPVYKDMIVEIFEGGYINEHTDPTVEGYKHLRCNILLQKPEEGGNIVINKNPIALDVGDMYVVDTSILHAVTTVKGSVIYRGITFGFLCDANI
jgi:hypothetical protein